MQRTPLTTRRAVGSFLALAGLAASAAFTVVPSAQAAPTVAPESPAATAAVAWMAGNLTDGVLRTGKAGNANLGLTLELGQSLLAVGGQDAAVQAIGQRLEANAATFIGETAPLISPLTKALMFRTATGEDPRSVGPDQVDLIAATESLLMTDQTYTGRLKSGTTWTQAYAATGLTMAGSPHATQVLNYALGQQCSAGFFRLSLGRTTDVDQTCDASTDAAKAQSADVSAAVAINLAPLAADHPEVAAALDEVGDWLLSQQQADGSFHDVFSRKPNANTTGLAGWALGTLGHTEAAGRAATWLRARQVVGACEPALATETGAVAYTDDAWADAAESGIADPIDRQQWLMVGAQAIPALKWAPAATGPASISVPSQVRPGAVVKAQIAGLAPGERACLSAPEKQALLGTGSALTVELPSAALGRHEVALETLTGTVKSSFQVAAPVVSPPTAPTATKPAAWPAKKFIVKAPRKAVRGTKVTVVVRGAKAGEKLRVKVPGRTVTRTANAAGTWRGKLKVTGKPGRYRVVVTGKNKQRKGTKQLRLIRR